MKTRSTLWETDEVVLEKWIDFAEELPGPDRRCHVKVFDRRPLCRLALAQ
jgi:hypothetical protein